MPYKILDHTADIAISAEAGKLPDVLLSLFEGWKEIALDGDYYGVCGKKQFEIKAETFEELAVNFIDEVNFLADVRKIICVEMVEHVFEQDDTGFRFTAVLNSVDNNDLIIKRKREIKAVTFHQAELKTTEAGYSLTLILDI